MQLLTYNNITRSYPLHPIDPPRACQQLAHNSKRTDCYGILECFNIAQQVLSLVPPLAGGEGHATGGHEHATVSPRAPQGVEEHATESPKAPQGGRGDATAGEGQAIEAPRGGDMTNSPDEQVTPIINTEVHIEINAQVAMKT